LITIKTDNLCKWYGNVLGASEISLEIDKGITGLLGPNGAGKSTFLKLICGQLKPNLGTVKIFDKKISSHKNVFEKIGYCPEIDSYYKQLTGKEFLYYLLKLYGLSHHKAEKQTEIALSQVGLLDRMDNHINTYSLGMRQRLKFAQSIAHDPEIMIFDEPLKGIDPVWKAKLIKLIKEFAVNNKTIIVSSHILSEIEAITDNIILIHQGKVFAKGEIHYIRDLIDTHPHMIFIKSEKSRHLASIIIKNKLAESVKIQTDGLTIKTRDRDSFFDLLMHTIVKENIEIEELTSPDDNLQAVFDYLVGSKK